MKFSILPVLALMILVFLVSSKYPTVGQSLLSKVGA